jgi:hypothetical protein
MRLCGISIAASCANLVVVEQADSTISVVDAIRKLCLKDDRSQDEVKSFCSTLSAFVRDNQIQHVYIKARNKRGDYAGGPVGFKVEGLIQLLEIPVTFLSPVGIASATKNIGRELVEAVYNYQEDALRTAVAGARQDVKDRS